MFSPRINSTVSHYLLTARNSKLAIIADHEHNTKRVHIPAQRPFTTFKIYSPPLLKCLGRMPNTTMVVMNSMTDSEMVIPTSNIWAESDKSKKAKP